MVPFQTGNISPTRTQIAAGNVLRQYYAEIRFWRSYIQSPMGLAYYTTLKPEAHIIQ